MHSFTYISVKKAPPYSQVGSQAAAPEVAERSPSGEPRFARQRLGANRDATRRLIGENNSGFTMIELMVVVIIIAVVAALTIPSIVSRMRERRAGEAASRVALLFQMARSEAIGRGAAVLVRYTQSARGAFLVREAQRGTSAGAGCQSLPEPSCVNTDFNNPAAQQYRDLTSLDLGQRAEYSQVRAVVVAPGGANPAALDLCFTPMGRTFVRTNLNGTFAPLTGIYQASVYRGDVGQPIGLTRNVMLLPNGVARIVAVAEPTP